MSSRGRRRTGTRRRAARPRVEVVGPVHHDRQRAGDRADGLEGQRGRDRVVTRRVHALDRVGEGVERRRPRHLRREDDGELGVVDDADRLDDRVATGLLVAIARQPVDRGLLAAGVGGRDGHDRQPVGESDRLGEPGGRSPAHTDDDVGATLVDEGTGSLGQLDRHVLHELVPPPGEPGAEHGGQLVADLRCRPRDQHRPLRSEPVDLVGDDGPPTGSEDHPLRLGLIDEVPCRCVSSRSRCLDQKSTG